MEHFSKLLDIQIQVVSTTPPNCFPSHTHLFPCSSSAWERECQQGSFRQLEPDNACSQQQMKCRGTSPQPSSSWWSLERLDRSLVYSQGRCHGGKTWKWDWCLGDRGKTERWITHIGKCLRSTLPCWSSEWDEHLRVLEGMSRCSVQTSVGAASFCSHPRYADFFQSVSEGVQSVLCKRIPLQA